MGRTSQMGQLAKGVVIGIVLLLAIIGTMSIFDSAKDDEALTTAKSNQGTQSTQSTASTSNTTAPPVSVNNTNQNEPVSQNQNQEQKNTSLEEVDDVIELNNAIPSDAEIKAENEAKIKAAKVAKQKQNKHFKPVLENERALKEIPVAKEDKKKKVEFGLLQVTAINPNTKNKLLASFVVLDKKGKKVAHAKNKKQMSFRLPVGKYKVITTLKKLDDVSRNIAPVKSIKTVRIRMNKKTTQSFKLVPPSILGVLQVTAKNAKNGKVIKANYTIQKDNGKTIATRRNVTHTLFKLKAGSYKVTVKSGNNSDSRTVVVEAGESINQEFKLQETYGLGKLRVRVFDTRSNKPVNANIIISKNNGVRVQELKAVSQTEVSVPAGRYQIRVTGPTGQSTKAINITGGQVLNEVFRFDVPQAVPTPVATTEVKTASAERTPPVKEQPAVVKTPQVAVQPAVKEVKTPASVKKQAPVKKQAKGSLLLYARDEGNNVPLKSNFYIQRTNGKNVSNKIYVESAQFALEPGVYRITVRSKNRKKQTKVIRITSGERLSEVFSLKSSLPKPVVQPKPERAVNKPEKQRQVRVVPVPMLAPQKPVKPVLAPQKPSKPVAIKKQPVNVKAIIPNGYLRVVMKPPRKTHFIVARKSGEKIVELTSVPNANFKLDTGDYIVTAIHNRVRKTKAVRVLKNKTSRIRFNSANFRNARNNQRNNRSNNAIRKGVLRSKIVNRYGKSLRGDLTVVNSRGQVVARATGVAVGVFNLPPEPYTIILDYNGLRGSERVNLRANKTTVQTFTVAPNDSAPDEYYPPRGDEPPVREGEFFERSFLR